MRVDKWRLALIEEIRRSQGMPFSYGSHDCLQFPARCVAVMTGIDHAAAFGTYTDPIPLMEQYGGVEGILTWLFGPICHPSEACDGDAVLAEVRGTMSAGIFMGGKFLIAREPVGLIALPRRFIKGCWKP